MDLNRIVGFYFYLGLQYREILEVLSHQHGIIMCLRTLQTLLRKNRLCRRKDFTDVLDVAYFVNQQLETSGQMVGYRMMHLKCIQEGLVVKRETVRLLLSVLDPVGVAHRRARKLRRRRYHNPGPNFMWHLDSYDKLKPYGLCINGCVDGFSRHLMWLKVSFTNSDPKVIASYYIETVKERRGCPQRIRADRGTENVAVEQMQMFLRRAATDDFAYHRSFIYGSSNHNQRIESIWSILRKENVQFWMNFFQTLKEGGHFTGDFLDRSLVQFCFMTILQVS